MARFIVEILLKSAGGPQAKAAVEAVGAGARGAAPSVERLASQVLGLEFNLKGLGSLAARAFGGFQLLQIGRQVLQEAKDAAAAQVLLQTVVRSTGGAAGYTASQLDEMADSFSRLTGIDDEVIAGAEAILLRYTRITREVFPEAIQLALDMASANGEQITSTQQLSGEAERLGKLLGDPARAIQLLKREGKGLEEEQILMIQKFLRQNDLIGAQKVLLAELKSLYGGTAAEMRNTLGGALQAVQTAWGNLLEEIGKGATMDTSGVDGLADTLSDPEVLSAAHQLGENIGIIASNVAKLTELLGPLVGKLAQLEQFVNPLTAVARMLSDIEARLPRLSIMGGRPQVFWPAPTNPPPAQGGPTGPPPPLPKPPPDTKALEHAQKLREAFAAILLEHQETERTQRALIALYARTGLSASQRLALEEKINNEHDDRLVALKAMKQFEDLGIKAAQAIAATLVRINQEERQRLDHLAAQKAELDGHVKALQAEAEWVAKIKEEVRGLFEGSMGNLLQTLQQLSTDQARDILAGRNTDAVKQANGEMFADLAANYREWAQDVNLEIRGSLMSAADIAEVEMQRIEAAWSEGHRLGVQGAMTVEEKERALGRIRSELLQQTLSEWGNFFGILESLFGGAIGKIAGQISNMIGRIQQAYQAGQSVAGGLGNMGVAGGTASAIGGAVGGVLIMAAVLRGIYEIRKAQKEAERLRQYSYGAGVMMGGQWSTRGEWNPIALTGQAREASLAIQRAAEELAAAMGGVLDTFARLEIKVRADGKYFQAFVEGELIGKFNSFAEAQDAALLAAFRSASTTLRGLGALVQQGLDQFRSLGTAGSSAAELQDWLGKLREISQLNWSDEARGVSETVRHLDELWSALLKVREVTPAVIEGFNNLIQAEVNAWNSWRRSLTGQKESPREQLARMQAEAQIFNAQKALRIAELKLRYEELKIQYEQLRARGEMVIAGGGIGRSEIDIGTQYLKARAEMVKAEASLYQAQLDAMAAAMEAILKLIDALAAIPDIDIGDVKLPRSGGGRGDARATALGRLEDMRAAAAGDVSVIMLQSKRDLEAWRKEAREGHLSQQQLAEGERLLRLEREKALRSQAEGYAGIGTDFTRSLAEGSNYFEGLRAAGRKETGMPNWLVDFFEGKFFAAKRAEFQQAVNQFFGFTNELQENALQADILRQNLAALAATGRMTAEEVEEAGRRITEALDIKDQLAINGLMQRLFEPLKDLPEFAEQALELKKQEVDLQYRILQAQLQTYGIWEDTKELWEASRNAALAAASGLERAANAWPGGETPGEEKDRKRKEAEEQRDAAQKILDAWKAAGESPLVRELRDFGADFAKVKAQFGETAEVLLFAGKKLDDILGRYLGPIRAFREGRQLSGLSTLTGEGQFFESQAQFRGLVSSILGGDLSKLDQFVGLAQKYGELAQNYTAGSGLRFIMKELDDAALKLEQLVPGIAHDQAGVPLGMASNPMQTAAPGTVTAITATTAAINTGNDLMLTEMRSAVSELRAHTGELRTINSQLANPLSVRQVA